MNSPRCDIFPNYTAMFVLQTMYKNSLGLNKLTNFFSFAKTSVHFKSLHTYTYNLGFKNGTIFCYFLHTSTTQLWLNDCQSEE